jgi:hypothetical protein
MEMEVEMNLMLSKHEEQLERRETLENDRRVREQGTTFTRFAQSEAAESRGRFTAHDTSTVIGGTPTPASAYPAAFLNHDPVPDEPPLGVDINEMPTCGEPHELAASISRPLGPSMQAKATPNPAAPHDASPHAPPSSSALVGGRVAGLGSFSSRTYRRA